jgi:hypothetical protein
MKIGGVEAKRRGELEPLVFSREDGNDLVFIAKPVYNLDEFIALCPEPDVKQFGKMTKDGWVPDLEAPQYLDLLRLRRVAHWDYTMIKSLEPSNINWDKVKHNDPKTWKHCQTELLSVLSYTEFSKVIGLVEEANTMDDAKLEENRESFFRKRVAVLEQTSPTSAQENMQSGQPANSSA